MLLLASCTMAAAADEAADPADDPQQDTLFATPTQLDRVGRIVAPVMINGRGPFRLLVDTGANATTLSTRLADELGIDYRNAPSIMMNGVTGRALVPVASIEQMQAGALILRDQQVPIVDPHIMANTDGILGIAALTDKQLVVDFRRDLVSIGKSRRLPSYLTIIKAKRLAAGLLAAPAFVGRISTIVVIDTGAQRTLGNNALHIALQRSHGASATVPVRGVTADIAQGTQILVEDIALGRGISVSKSPVTFGDFHVFDLWDLSDQPALILGMDIIGQASVFVIDFRRQEIGFRG
ncbi:MAG TPA: retropepsin-like aspartic protease [Povalibacter sp.]|nr:retropepsin-like aspartic protease [Povalibacter sp.]